MPCDPAPAHDRAGQVGHRGPADDRAESDAGDAVGLEVEIGRTGEEPEVGGVAERVEQGPRAKRGVAQDPRVAGEQRPEPQGVGLECASRLRHPHQHECQASEPEQAHRTQGGAPAQRFGQQGARNRHHHRDAGQRRHRDRHHVRAMLLLVEVAHHRACAHHRRGDAQALQHTCRDQHLDGGRERTEAGRSGIQQEAGDEHRAAPETVGRRPPEQLAQAEAEHERGQRQLHHADRRGELVADRRQRRQVEIGAQRLRRGGQRHHHDDQHRPHRRAHAQASRSLRWVNQSRISCVASFNSSGWPA